MIAVNNRNRRAPITLTAHEPVTQTIVGFESAFALFFKFFEDCEFCVLTAHTVKLAAVCEYAVLAERKRIVNAVFAFDDSLDRQAEFLRKHEIALVVSGNAHNRSRTVTCDNVVRNQDRHFFSVDGIDCVSTRRNARLFSR